MTPPAPRHVFMTADTVGGVWTYALDLAEAFASRGVRTTLAVLGPGPSPAQKRAAGAIAGLRLIATGLPLDWMASDPAVLAAAGRRLALMAGESGADIVHLNSPALAAADRFEQPVVGVCHSCLATWWDAVRGGDLPNDFTWKTELLAAGYAACDALIAPSYAFMQATAARYRIVPHMVRNGRAARRQWSTPSKSPFALASGRFWDDAKNVHALDAAASRMTCNRVYAAGPLSHGDAEPVALDSVIALGSVAPDALAGWLARAAVFVSFALYEPFGLGVLEAAQAGCALVLSDIPTHRELWEGAAVFIDPADADAAAGVLDRLLAAPAEAARLGALAERRSRDFTAEAMAEGALAIYRRLLADHAALSEAAA